MKVQSHAGAEKRFRRGSVQTNRPFTGRLAAQRDVRRGRGRGDFCMSVFVFLHALNACVCVCVCEVHTKNTVYNPPKLEAKRGIIEQKDWQREK